MSSFAQVITSSLVIEVARGKVECQVHKKWACKVSIKQNAKISETCKKEKECQWEKWICSQSGMLIQMSETVWAGKLNEVLSSHLQQDDVPKNLCLFCFFFSNCVSWTEAVGGRWSLFKRPWRAENLSLPQLQIASRLPAVCKALQQKVDPQDSSLWSVAAHAGEGRVCDLPYFPFLCVCRKVSLTSQQLYLKQEELLMNGL